MTLSDFASIATIIQGVVVIISLVFIWFQLRQNAQLARVANTQSLVEISSPYNLQLIQDREMAKLWVQGSKEYEQMDAIDQYRYHSLLIWWLIFHENIFHQNQKKLLDQESYDAWERDLDQFIGYHHLERFWTELKEALQAPFTHYLDQKYPNLMPGTKEATTLQAEGGSTGKQEKR